MIKIENVEVLGWEHAIRGARNPMNSWEKSDSGDCCYMDCSKCQHHDIDCRELSTDYIIGHNDMDLMTRLRNAGTDHRKFMRMITVYADLTAPLYFWKEWDTYKVGTVANSCSTMHKIHAKEFTKDDFSHEHLWGAWDIKVPEDEVDTDCWIEGEYGETILPFDILEQTIAMLNKARNLYLEYLERPTKNLEYKKKVAKKYWWQMIQLLPSSYNQKRTVMLNYEVLANMYHSRKAHKLDEWREFCEWIKTLPYSELITGAKEAEPIVSDNSTIQTRTEFVDRW